MYHKNQIREAILRLYERYEWVHYFPSSVAINDSAKNQKGLPRGNCLALPSSSNEEIVLLTRNNANSLRVQEISGAADMKIVPSSTPRKFCFRLRFKMSKLIYERYNEKVFSNLLPHDLSITWSKRMTSTAGITRLSKSPDGRRVAEIELSVKVSK